MNIKEVAWDKIKWTLMKNRLGYNSEEMKIFRNNPRNEAILDTAAQVQNRTIIIEVYNSRGCNSQHKVGDKFYFDGAGNLLTELCPKKICIFALNAISTQIFTAGEFIMAGVDPNDMKFKRAACFDVGVECGGWGRVVMEISVVDREKV